MKLSCPACNAEFTLDVVLANSAARDAMMHALAMPSPLGKLLLAYLGCFRPPKRQLSWDRLAALMGELRQPIETATVVRNGSSWPAPMPYWIQGLETVLQARDKGSLMLPLKSHGYLFEVIAALSNKSEARAEAAVENKRRGATGVGISAAHFPAEKLDTSNAVAMPDSMRASLRRKPQGEAEQ